jgi:hypothetical protein
MKACSLVLVLNLYYSKEKRSEENKEPSLKCYDTQDYSSPFINQSVLKTCKDLPLI